MQDYLPFAATENIMMEAVKKGKDRQKVHEIIRRHSMEAIEKLNNGEKADLLGMLCEDEELGLDKEELQAIMRPEMFIGRSVEQTKNYLESVKPLIEDVIPDDPQVEF